jgi:hypothetical protein
MCPLVGLELDDRSHQRRDRQERDEFVEQVFAAARLPLARIPAKWAYQTAHLNAVLREKAGLGAALLAAALEPAGEEPRPAAPPTCPKRGANQGK